MISSSLQSSGSDTRRFPRLVESDLTFRLRNTEMKVLYLNQHSKCQCLWPQGKTPLGWANYLTIRIMFYKWDLESNTYGHASKILLTTSLTKVPSSSGLSLLSCSSTSCFPSKMHFWVVPLFSRVHDLQELQAAGNLLPNPCSIRRDTTASSRSLLRSIRCSDLYDISSTLSWRWKVTYR